MKLEPRHFDMAKKIARRVGGRDYLEDFEAIAYLKLVELSKSGDEKTLPSRLLSALLEEKRNQQVAGINVPRVVAQDMRTIRNRGHKIIPPRQVCEEILGRLISDRHHEALKRALVVQEPVEDITRIHTVKEEPWD